MHKVKKKTKTVKLPKPIKVKKEKSDEDRMPQPMTHYIDDRLEMIKQIFGTLKPKTIVNLAPDFIKTKSLEEIEEACLNELLCISTKRLKSIITATKCPSDTESDDDDDSDVERQEEHVSLEEISSDSGGEGSSKKAKRKKTAKDIATAAAKKDDSSKPDSAKTDDGQISVLELLELQARARAIRSQLALEPVTKIEVDSDDEKQPQPDTTSSKQASQLKRKSDGKESSATLNGSNGGTHSAIESAEKTTTKKIKIKRNLKPSNIESNKVEESRENKHKETIIEDNAGHNKEDIKKEKSPDVIPIVPEHETLEISDSDDEGKIKDKDATGVESMKEAGKLDKPENNEKSSTENAKTDVENIDENTCQELKTNKQQAVYSEPNESEESSRTSNESSTNDKGKRNSSDYEDDDQNDDVISLGGDLENEMNEELEKANFSKEAGGQLKKLTAEEKIQTDDAISLDSSDNESWRSRYAKSSKVNKVLAAARLSKKVRDKIKKSKRTTNEPAHDETEAEKDKSASAFNSKHEDGSMEQYKELLEHRQRKTSGSNK